MIRPTSSPPPEIGPPQSGGPPTTKAMTVAVFLIVFVASAYFIHPDEYANSACRWALIRAIVDDHTLCIDRYHEETTDKALVAGHYYCDKAPGSSLWGVPVYWTLQQIAHWRGPFSQTQARFFTRLWVSSIPTAVAACALLLILRGQSLSWPAAAAIALLYALGTCAWSYSTLLYGHQLAAMFIVLAFALLMDTARGGGDLSTARLVGAGLCVGCAVLAEFPVALAGAVLAVAGLWRARPRWRFAWFLLGGLPLACVLGAYNAAAFGSPWSSGYDHVALEYYQDQMAEGVRGVTFPRLSSLWLITGSLSRGLFTGSPFLLLAIPGFVLALRHAPRRAPWITAAAIAVVFLLFNASYFSPEGGNANGPRHLLPAVPFVALLCGGVLLPGRSSIWQLVLVGLAIPAVLRQVAATAIHPHVDSTALNPWRDFWQPLWERGLQATSTLGLRLPLGLNLLLLAALLLLIWLPLIGSPRQWFARLPESSPWRRPAAYSVVLALAVAFLSLNWLVPKTPGAIHSVGVAVALYRYGFAAEARDQYRAATQLPIESDEDRQIIAMAWHNLGRFRFQEGEFAEAATCLRRSLELNPQELGARHLLALALERQGLVDDARSELEKILRIDPDDARARQKLAELAEPKP